LHGFEKGEREKKKERKKTKKQSYGAVVF